MATNKRLQDLTSYKSVLPYGSEIFGIYQPLLGWKGKRNIHRFITKPLLTAYLQIEGIKQHKITPSIDKYFGNYERYLKIKEKGESAGNFKTDVPFIEKLNIQTGQAQVEDPFIKMVKYNWGLESVNREDIEKIGIEKFFNEKFINESEFNNILNKVSDNLLETYQNNFGNSPKEATQTLIEKANHASITARRIIDLYQTKQFNAIKDILFGTYKEIVPTQFIENPFEAFDPTKQLQQVGLSPIGIVHLFRQYFFELDTFLGTPVGHVWISPGSSVELIETSTRRTLVERYSEENSEHFLKNETSTTEKDELSEAIKQENENSIKFGANVNAEQKWGWGEASQSASFDMKTTQKQARETTHMRMREQSTKLSAEIRKNYKTTFKTVTETTDLTSKKMVLTNSTEELINYELRRKMRQVAVQVQDIGTYLCWQTYVDRPGNMLGLSNLVHIAQKPDGQSPQPPEDIPEMLPFSNQETITIDCIGLDNQFDDNALDEFYVPCHKHHGAHLKEDNGHEYIIQRVHKKKITPKAPGYKLVDIKFDGNTDVTLDARISNPYNGEFEITLNSINFQNKTNMVVNATSYWEVDKSSTHYMELEAKRAKQQILYDNAKRQEYETQYVTAARERIKLASNIQSRKYEELREEERVVVYRELIKALGKEVVYKKGKIEKKDGQTVYTQTQAADSDFHVFYEILNSIFDIDKMLYFVAPEWWRSKKITQLQFGSESLDANNRNTVHQTSQTVIPKSNFVTWGEPRHNNYLITEDSTPAKLGSSLGWLLQLDGDNLRNAFLNSPWVKAVIPIRPGREREALNWLKHVEGMNGITEKDMYQGPESEHQGKTLIQVLENLADKVKEKHEKGKTTKGFPENDETEVVDDRNIVNATPVDRVYEHGFYPLKGGFRFNVDKEFQIFDQWIEVLPTDQVVPVEVKYDPITGRQI